MLKTNLDMNKTCKQITLETIYRYRKFFNLKNIIKLFINSLIFRGLIYILLLIIPSLTAFIMPSILTYIFIIKPYKNSQQNLRLYFENLLYAIFIVITLFVLWWIILTSLSYIFPLAVKFLLAYWGDIGNSNKITFNFTDISKLDKNSSENFETKKIDCKHKLKKIYDSVFDKDNKPIKTINPFPFIKEGYIKTSSLKVNLEADNINFSGLTESNSLKLTKKELNHLGYGSNHSETDVLSSEKVVDNSFTTVIDLKVYLGLNENNKTSIILRDSNDPTSKNLISTLKNSNSVEVAFDKSHYDKNNCYNHKYLKFELENSKYVKYNKEVLHRFKSLNYQDSAMVKEISFSINEQTVTKLKNLSLIIDCEDINLPPVKQQTSFATQAEKFSIGDWKIVVPVYKNLTKVNIISNANITNTPNICESCLSSNYKI